MWRNNDLQLAMTFIMNDYSPHYRGNHIICNVYAIYLSVCRRWNVVCDLYESMPIFVYFSTTNEGTFADVFVSISRSAQGWGRSGMHWLETSAPLRRVEVVHCEVVFFVLRARCERVRIKSPHHHKVVCNDRHAILKYLI